MPDALSAEVQSQRIFAEIALEFNSKNKLPTDTVTINEDFSRTTAYIREFTDDITLVDTPDVGQIYREDPANSVSIGDEVAVAIQYNLLFTDSITSSEIATWTIGKNIVESISTNDTPSIGDIHRVSPSDSLTASDILLADYDGMLNTNMLNTRVLSVGSLEVSVSDVQITVV